MILYSVTVTVSPTVHDEWFEWMHSVHIPDVLRTGFFLSATMYRVHQPAPEHGEQYTIQYACRTMDDYERYSTECAPQLQAEHTEKFQGHCTASRTIMESLPA